MLIIKAKKRKKPGKSSSRRLRGENKFPCVIYGANESPLAIELKYDDVVNSFIKPEFHNNTLVLLIDEEKRINVKIKSVQYHPYKLKLVHIDFIRV